MDPNERQRQYQVLQEIWMQGERAKQQMARMAMEEAQMQQAPFNYAFQQQQPMPMLAEHQPGPSLHPAALENVQTNAQGQMQARGPSNVPVNQVQPYGWQGYVQTPQTQAGTIHPPYPQHHPAPAPRNHPNAVGPPNPNSVPQVPQAQPPAKQGRAPPQSSKSGQNPLQQQLDAMTHAYARNATAAYISPSSSSSVPQSSQRNAQPQSNGVPPNSVHIEQQQPHYRSHVYVAPATGTVPGPSQPSQSSLGVQPQAQAHPQRAQGASTTSSPSIPTQSNAATWRHPPTGQIPSVMKPPVQPTYPPVHPQQSQPQPQRGPPRPPSNTSVPAAAPQPPKERVVDIPSWSTSLVNTFKQQCFTYFHNAPVESTMDMYQTFQFARGFVLQKQDDGVWLVDTRDNMKAPFSGLVGELENRQVPDNAPGGQRSFGGPPAVANTAQAAISTPQLPNQRPPPVPAPAIQSGKAAPGAQITLPTIATIGAGQQRLVGVPVKPSAPPQVSTPQRQGPPSERTPSVLSRSPADANRRTLAKDILYALGKRTRSAAESEAGPDPKRTVAPSMSVFRLDGNVQQSWSVLPDQGGMIDLSQLPVLPAAPPKPYEPPFAATAPTLSRPSSRPPTTAPTTSTPAPPPPIAGTAIAPVAPSVIASSRPPPLQAPQPRTAVPDRQHEALLPRIVKERAANTSEPVASSSSTGHLQVTNSPSLPPIATINDPGPSRDVTPANAVKGPTAKDDGSRRTSTPQLATAQSGKKGKGRARSIASDAASLPPPSRASSKASRVPPTSSSPGTSVVVDLTSPSPPAVSRAESEVEPLFLPSGSPPQSPILRDYSLFTPERQLPSRGQREQRAYVFIPPPSPRTRRFMELKREEFRRAESSKAPTSSRSSSSRATSTVAGRVNNLPLPPYVAGEDVEYDYSFDQHGHAIEDPAERRLMELAFTRMQPVECKWDRCDFVANSAMSLLAHYKKHHQPAPTKNGTSKPFSCLWTQCGKQCRYQEIRHFIKHALDSLTCPHADCEERFRTIGKLRRHVEKHADGSELKPGCKPFRPLNLAPPRPSPATLPAYLTATPLVPPAAIGAARHAKLLPWVKKGTTGLAKRGQPRPGRPPGRKQGEGTLHEPRIDRNEDLIDYSTRYSSYVSEPANVKAGNIDEPEMISRLSMAGRVSILNEGTDSATIEWLDTNEVKEEEISPSPLQHRDPLLLRSESRFPPPQPTFEVLSSDAEEVEEDELAGDTQGDDSEVEAMLL